MKLHKTLLALLVGGMMLGSAGGALGAEPRVLAPVVGQDPEAAPASASVPVEIMVLHATNDGGGIDPSIGPMPQLRKPPFSAYSSYKLLSRQTASLSQAKPDTTKLPNGRVLKTALLGMIGADRYRISASINQPKADAGAHTFLPLLEVTARKGEIFFVAGQSYQGGMLVVGIKIGK